MVNYLKTTKALTNFPKTFRDHRTPDTTLKHSLYSTVAYMTVKEWLTLHTVWISWVLLLTGSDKAGVSQQITVGAPGSPTDPLKRFPWGGHWQQNPCSTQGVAWQADWDGGDLHWALVKEMGQKGTAAKYCVRSGKGGAGVRGWGGRETSWSGRETYWS